MAQKKRFTRKSRLLILPHVKKKKKKKKRPSNPAVARNIWTQFWSRVWQFERTHLQKVQMPGGCWGSRGGGGEKGGNVEAMN